MRKSFVQLSVFILLKVKKNILVGSTFDCGGLVFIQSI